MKTRLRLLSPRFRDDGRAHVPLGPRARAVVRELRALLSGEEGAAARVWHRHCPLCGAGEADRIAEKDRHGLPLPVNLCPACGLVYSAAYLAPAFAARYYAGPAGAFKLEDESAEAAFRRRIAPGAYCWRRHRYVRDVLAAAYERVETVAEIGCADGCNLVPYVGDGKRAIGCDFDQARLAAGRGAGLDLVAGDLETLLAGGVRAGLVILSHVLEHVGEIGATLARVRRLLTPDGVLYVEVPGLAFIRPRADALAVDGYASSHDLLGYLQFEHAYHLDLAALDSFAASAGYRRLAGDEVVRAILVPACTSEGGVAPATGRAEDVRARLDAAERSYLSPANALRRALRRPYLLLRRRLGR
ncbi:MAG: class I SAM-dependent methyltransferase [Proteobacteria bacterium]|nr:class I SAM-dependent methyltransferase [Pseudomonadota bacterium]